MLFYLVERSTGVTVYKRVDGAELLPQLKHSAQQASQRTTQGTGPAPQQPSALQLPVLATLRHHQRPPTATQPLLVSCQRGLFVLGTVVAACNTEGGGPDSVFGRGKELCTIKPLVNCYSGDKVKQHSFRDVCCT